MMMNTSAPDYTATATRSTIEPDWGVKHWPRAVRFQPHQERAFRRDLTIIERTFDRDEARTAKLVYIATMLLDAHDVPMFVQADERTVSEVAQRVKDALANA